MPYITEINNDGELNTALQNFSTVCAANVATLGLNPVSLNEISGAASAFNSTFNAATAAKATAKSTVESKDVQKRTSKAIISKYAKLFRATSTIPDALLEQLMLPHHKTPATKTPPTVPTNLVASADGNGVIKLKWNRNGNSNLTQFLIESRPSPSGEWQMIGGTTQSKFETVAVPGNYIAFRVSAQRRDLTSTPSTPVILWENGDTNE